MQTHKNQGLFGKRFLCNDNGLVYTTCIVETLRFVHCWATKFNHQQHGGEYRSRILTCISYIKTCGTDWSTIHTFRCVNNSIKWWIPSNQSNCNQNRMDKYFLALSQTTYFKFFQTERVCRWQFQIWCKWQKVPQMGRKHCEKRRNCSLWAITPFPTVFSRHLYCRHIKTKACLGQG